jgi:hypothetical protein
LLKVRIQARIYKFADKATPLFGLSIQCYMPKMTTRESKISEFIKRTLTEAKRQELQELMGLSNYQWTWHMNYPHRWEKEKVVILAFFLNLNWEHLARVYELGKDKNILPHSTERRL